ncbi:MAG: hypothetical protein AAF840_17240, partial [Bacteroidota bacterium]
RQSNDTGHFVFRKGLKISVETAEQQAYLETFLENEVASIIRLPKGLRKEECLAYLEVFRGAVAGAKEEDKEQWEET